MKSLGSKMALYYFKTDGDICSFNPWYVSVMAGLTRHLHYVGQRHFGLSTLP